MDKDGVDNIQVMVDDNHVLGGEVELVVRRRAKYHDYIVFMNLCIGIRLQMYSRPILWVYIPITALCNMEMFWLLLKTEYFITTLELFKYKYALM